MTPKKFEHKQIQEMLEKISKWPWKPFDNSIQIGDDNFLIETNNPFTGDSSNDTYFIAASPQIVAQLLEEVKELKREKAYYKADSEYIKVRVKWVEAFSKAAGEFLKTPIEDFDLDQFVELDAEPIDPPPAGIQWKKFEEERPEEGRDILIWSPVTTGSDILYLRKWELARISFTHWAYVNLPQEEGRETERLHDFHALGIHDGPEFIGIKLNQEFDNIYAFLRRMRK